ncbi:hypothetical protein Hte_001048 [Hypoxylon texense]
MQEHIRRAHPEHYISKLPATEESFLLMINTPPSDRSQVQNSTGPPQTNLDPNKGYPHERHAYPRDESSAPGTPRANEDYPGGSLLPAASAAAALAQLGGQHKFEAEWDHETGWQSDNDGRRIPRSTIELPPIHMGNEPTSEPFPSLNSGPRRDLLPSILSNSPPGRSSTLPPLQRPLGPNRPRKQSITKRGHKKQKSRGSAADWLRRIQNDERLKPGGIDRKAHSVEPTADYGKRWEDLIDAAASATEDIDEDRTPATKLLLCNKLLLHRPFTKRSQNLFPPSRVAKAETTSISERLDFQTHRQVTRPKKFISIVPRAKERRNYENPMHARSAFADYVEIASIS